MSRSRIAALALTGVVLLGAPAALPAQTAAVAVAQEDVAAPAASLESGRYVGAQSVTLSAQSGAEIRYTLDGTHPTRQSAVADGPIHIATTANLTAVAFTARGESEPTIRGILVKTSEEPLSQFAVMSDIHLSTGEGPAMAKWIGYFDALKRIVPQPDAIISNGDQINDNHFNSAKDHQYPRRMLEENLARTGMTDTKVMMSFGNHDDYVYRMAAEYPREWFPTETGYYESTIGGFPAIVVNTEAWNSTQAEWLRGRLDALTADPATQGQPVFVFGHRPIPATVWDGAQASNGGLKQTLGGFPQVVYFSGHSHLNITDERSIHQQDFTSVNEGSMSYGENNGKFQIFGDGLAHNATIPTAQSVVVDVYADRIEIDRINYAAEPGRTYTDDGTWGFQENPPFASSGSLAGPTWAIGRGATPAETKSKFSYTSEHRNTVAPVWGEQQPSVRQTDSGPVLRLPQSSDDQFTAEYTLEVVDKASGATATLVPANGRIYSDYVVAPKPAVLDIPLAVRKDNKPGQPIDRTLEAGRAYTATLVAYDSYGNASEPRSFDFIAGEVDRSGIEAAAAAAEPTLALLERVLGVDGAGQSEEGDYGYAAADSNAAKAAIAALREQLAGQPTTQDAADELSAAIQDAANDLPRLLVTVDRSGLAAAVAEVDNALRATGVSAAGTSAASHAASDAVTKAERALRAELNTAKQVQRTLNVAQSGIDGATAKLREAQRAWNAAVDAGNNTGGPGDGGTGTGGTGTGGTGTGGTGTGGTGTGGTGTGGLDGSHGEAGDSAGSTARDALAASGAAPLTAVAIAVVVALATGAALLGARRSRRG